MGIMNIVDVLTCVFTFVLALFAYKTWRISFQNARVELVFKLQEAYEHSVAGLFSKYFEDNVDFILDDTSIRPAIAEREISFILSWFSTLGWMYEGKLVGDGFLARYRPQIGRIAGDYKVCAYLRHLAAQEDRSMIDSYMGFVRIAWKYSGKNILGLKFA